VLMPISAPKPNWWPSLKRVEAFQSTTALSIPARNFSAVAASAVTIVSVWCEPCVSMCSMAAAQSSTIFTARMRSRNSVR